jgi:hypothetical protein
MDDMKGVGRIIMTCLHNSRGRVQLLRFGDGSLSVRVNGRTVSVWEFAEQEAGVRSFLELIQFGQPPAPGEGPNLVIFRSACGKDALLMN